MDIVLAVAAARPADQRVDLPALTNLGTRTTQTGEELLWSGDAFVGRTTRDTLTTGEVSSIDVRGDFVPVGGLWDGRVVSSSAATLWDLETQEPVLSALLLVTALPDLDGDGREDLASEDRVWWGPGPTAGPMFDRAGEALSREPTVWDADRSYLPARVRAVPDLDGDGLPELLRGADTSFPVYGELAAGRLSLLLSSGRPADPEATWAPAWTLDNARGAPAALTFAQVDEDPDPELLALLGDSSSPGDADLVVYDALTADRPPAELARTFLGGARPILVESIGDRDGDGDDELLVGLQTGFAPVDPDWVADGAIFQIVDAEVAPGPFWTRVGDQPEPTDVEGRPLRDRGLVLAAVADLDGDGTRDLAIAAGQGPGEAARLQLWRLEPARSLTEPEPGDTAAPGSEPPPPDDTGAATVAPEEPPAARPGAEEAGCGCDAARGGPLLPAALGVALGLRRRRARFADPVRRGPQSARPGAPRTAPEETAAVDGGCRP